MKGFVLAAGFGSRLRPLTDVVPKPLLRVGQTPLIGYALRLLAHHDIREVIVNTHHLDERLREEVGDGSEFEVDIVYSHEPEILGTGGAIKKMQAALDETFVLLNSDVLIGLDLADVIASHHRSGGIATMVLREDADHPASGAIEIDKDDCVRRILGDGDASANLQPMMFTGCHVIEPRFLEYLPPEVESCIVRYGYRKALANAESINAYRHDGLWLDAGTPEQFLEANRWFLNGRLNLPSLGVGLSARPADGLEIDASASVHAGANLVPPVSVGPKAKIADGAQIGPDVVVQSRATVGSNARLERCVVFPEAAVEDGSTWSDAILGQEDSIVVDSNG